MKAGDLVRRIHISVEHKQRSLEFGYNARDYGVVTEADLEKGVCAVLFNGDIDPVTLPMHGGYLEVINESEEKD